MNSMPKFAIGCSKVKEKATLNLNVVLHGVS